MGGGAGIPGVDGVLVDDHDIWNSSTVSKDEARQVVKDMVNQASQMAGNAPGHLVDAIRDLQDPKIHWKYVLKQFVGRHLGGKRVTYARRNRRHNRFGVPGKSNHASVPLTICVDTSGSVSTALLDQFFSEIEAMAHRFKITLVQFDHGIQKIERYHRGDYKNLEIHGRGGTSFTKVFDGIEKNRVVGKLVIMLTDGYAPFGDPRSYPVIWAINTDVEPPWGELLHIPDIQ